MLAAMENRLNEYVFHMSTEVTPTFGSLRPPLLDNELVESQLLRCTLEHALLNTALCDETEYIDLLRLADTMSTIHCLQVGLRIPVAVVQDDDVGSRQVDSEPASACCQQEDELLTVRLVVLVNRDDTVLMGRTTINTTVLCRRSQPMRSIGYVIGTYCIHGTDSNLPGYRAYDSFD